jgi:hypothetical protein
MPGFYVAAAVVTLLSFLRAGDRRLLLLLVLFLFQAAARLLASHPSLALACDLVSGSSGLALVWTLAPATRRSSH